MTAIAAHDPAAPGTVRTSIQLASLKFRDNRFHVVESRAGNPDWQEMADYIGVCFHRRYGARTNIEMPRLIGLRNEQNALLAAVGLRDALQSPLFLEQYLDAPIEVAVAERQGRPVSRREIIEIGHLAGCGRGMSRFLFATLTALLTEWDYPWIAFTGTREVRCIFQRLNLSPVQLCAADPTRLPGGGSNWGSYYRHDPRVMFGEVAGGHRTLRDHGFYQMMNLELDGGLRHAVA